ncbi:MAG: glycosyltransferase, partial [Desulfovibrionaceae bacterium]
MAGLLEHLASLDPAPAEILIVDGESPPSTLQAAPAGAAKLLASPKGRAVQMNLGAAASGQPVLLFLHADTWLPADALALAMEALDDDRTAAGAFRLAFDQRSPGLDLIARVANLRTRRTRVPYGDQAIFVRRSAFFALGG